MKDKDTHLLEERYIKLYKEAGEHLPTGHIGQLAQTGVEELHPDETIDTSEYDYVKQLVDDHDSDSNFFIQLVRALPGKFLPQRELALAKEMKNAVADVALNALGNK